MVATKSFSWRLAIIALKAHAASRLALILGAAHQSAALVAANGGRPGFRVLFLGLLFFVFRSSAVLNPQEKLRNLLWSS